jgi:sulfur relay (sulfurtransferase) DsrF/TusC family protein
MKANGIVDE